MATLARLGSILILTAWTGAARAEAPSFSADVSVTLTGEDAEQLRALATKAGQPFEPRMKARLFVSGTRMRFEMLSGPQRGIMVSDGANGGKTWLLQPDSKSYVELDDGDGEGEGGGAELARFLEKGGDICKLSPAAVSCKKTGRDTVGGRACQTYELVENAGDAPQTLCVDETLHFPIRMVEASSTTELTKVVEAPQPKTLFTLPAGYTKKKMGE